MGKVTRSKIFLFCILSFIVGVFLASFFNFPLFLILEILTIGIVFVFLKNKKFLIFGLCLLLLGVGILRVNLEKPVKEKDIYGDKEKIFLEKIFSSSKNRLRQKIYENFSPPSSSFLAALTLGDKGRISEKWKKKLNRAGVRHIVVISGMHIFILSSLFFFLFSGLGISKRKVFLLLLVFLWTFICFVGFEASSVRAGIFASLFFLGETLGRQRDSKRILIFTAFLMLLFNPFLLRYGVGFQLSFLAVLGISFFFSFFQKKLKKILPFSVASLVGVTFSAQLLTFPLLLYYFGLVSFGALLANLLIVPLLPFVMGLGFLFLIFSVSLSFLSFIFYYPLYLLLLFFKQVILFFSEIKFLYIKTVPSLWYFLLYIPILFWLLFKKRKFWRRVKNLV